MLIEFSLLINKNPNHGQIIFFQPDKFFGTPVTLNNPNRNILKDGLMHTGGYRQTILPKAARCCLALACVYTLGSTLCL